MESAFIEFVGVTKTFAGVTALRDVTFSIARGETHGLMGENGAGKSTLGKMLAGIHRPNSGEIRIAGAPVILNSPKDAAREGIGMVHQELAFCPDLSVAENLAMGHYPRKFGLMIDSRQMRERADELLGQIGVQMDVRRHMRTLSTAQEQLVQIAAAIGAGARILVFDEPTSSLSEPEAQALFKLIDDLHARGVTIIYVSHRMPEVFRLCDRMSVLRDGQYIGTLTREEATQDKIVQMMIGRSVAEYFPQHLASAPGKMLLEVQGLSSPGKFSDVSFQVRAGEIVGLAGLVGSGRSEVACAIFGLDNTATGAVTVDDQPMPLRSIHTAMHRGLGLVPEDRKRQGLVLMMGGRENYSLAMLDRLQRFGVIRRKQEFNDAQHAFNQLSVKTPSLQAPVASMSGGNQQKVVIAKWLARGGKVLMVDEPTRGVDVGAKAAIHKLIDELARKGMGILLISSELPEVLSLSTRILVMREGRIVGEIPRATATQENVLRMMAGVGEPQAAAG